jgi:hypothetical protein
MAAAIAHASSSKATQEAAQQASKQRNSRASKQGKAARKRGSTARHATAMVCRQQGSGKAKQAATTTSKALANGVEEG